MCLFVSHCLLLCHFVARPASPSPEPLKVESYKDFLDRFMVEWRQKHAPLGTVDPSKWIPDPAAQMSLMLEAHAEYTLLSTGSYGRSSSDGTPGGSSGGLGGTPGSGSNLRRKSSAHQQSKQQKQSFNEIMMEGKKFRDSFAKNTSWHEDAWGPADQVS